MNRFFGWSRLLLVLLLAASLSSCCEDRDLPVCGIEGPVEVAPHTPFTITIGYWMAGCIDHEKTSITRDGTHLVLRGDGESCPCNDCNCAQGPEYVEYEVDGLDPGTYQIRGAIASTYTCDGTPVLELVVR